MFVMDLSDAPNYGFNNRRGAAPDSAAHWSQTHLATGGPDGAPAVRFTELGGGDADPFQHYIFAEHANSGELEIPDWGESVYIGIWWTLNSPFLGTAQPDPIPFPGSGDGSRWGNKFIIYGQGGPPSHRVIVNFAAQGDPETAWFYVERGIEGAPSRITIADPMTLDHLYKVQFRLTASSVQDALDAEFAVYVDGDNADENDPTFSSTGFAWNAPLIGDTVNLGGFSDTGDNVTSGGITQVVFDVFRFEIRSTFDDTFGDSAVVVTRPPMRLYLNAARVE
jgi:hypothetical protein